MSIKNDLFYISQLRFLQEEYAITDLVIETIIQLNSLLLLQIIFDHGLSSTLIMLC